VSQSQVHTGTVTMGVTPIIVRPMFGISQGTEVHVGRVGSGASITIIGQPA
jgi:predicted transcriptional regulator